MANDTRFEREKPIPLDETHERKPCHSKTSVQSQKSAEESSSTRRPKSTSATETVKVKRQLKVRSKTAENDFNDGSREVAAKSELSRTNHGKNVEKCEKEDLGSISSKKTTSTIAGSVKSSNSTFVKSERMKNTRSAMEPANSNSPGDSKDNSPKKLQKKNSEVLNGNPQAKAGAKFAKRPSVIPKLKTIVKGSCPTPPTSTRTVAGTQSKLPVKTKVGDEKQNDGKPEEAEKYQPRNIRMALKSYRVKREAKLDEKIKEAMKTEFGFLLPLYENEFKKISDVWMNTLYCSLTMRTNLVKLLYQAFPEINRSQFQTEEDILLRYMSHTKSYAKGEADNLLHFIKAIQSNREKLKDQYVMGMSNREIAQVYNYDWRYLTRKITELNEETRQLQTEVPELQKKKELYETTQSNKIREMELSIEKKNAQVEKMMGQLALLKEKESAYKKNIFLKLQDYKDVKADVYSLKSLESEYEAAKVKFNNQNEIYEKKIRDLETMLEDKKKILEREKEVKQKLQGFLNNLHTLSVGKEQVDYINSRSPQTREKRREQLWTAAVKLVLKGFLIQLKRLEKDRNKMLLEIQSNDASNFNALASSLVKRDSFMKTIKCQINDLEKAYKYSNIQQQTSLSGLQG